MDVFLLGVRSRFEVCEYGRLIKVPTTKGKSIEHTFQQLVVNSKPTPCGYLIAQPLLENNAIPPSL